MQNPNSAVQEAKMLLDAGDKQAAIAAMARYLQANPEDASDWRLLGEMMEPDNLILMVYTDFASLALHSNEETFLRHMFHEITAFEALMR